MRCTREDHPLAAWRRHLLSRRRFLLRAAGGSLALLFARAGLGSESAQRLDEAQRWRLLDAVQRHLLPSEPDSPGAQEINALGYLRFVVADPKVDEEERQFILQGAGWLEELAAKQEAASFLDLDPARREQLLRRVAASSAGENWLSTLLLYLMEALLTDPAYGGNSRGIGWRWLRHIPGFPRPTPDKIYPKLPL